MSGRIWKKEEIECARKKVAEGENPVSFRGEFNKKFPPGRSATAIRRKLQEDGVSYDHTHQPQIEDIDLRTGYDQKIKLLTSQLKAITDKYGRVIDGLNIQDRVVEAGKSCVGALPPVKQPTFPKSSKHKTTEQAVLLLSDTHLGEVVRDDEMRGLNEYNVNISNKRIKHLVNTVADLTANKLSGYNIEKLNLFLLGDMVCGAIHEELSETGEGNIMDWTVNIAYILAQVVQELLMTFPTIDIVGVVGNHGRTRKQVRYKERYVNWDFAAYQYLSMFLAEEIKVGKVVCKFPTSFWTTHDVLGWNWLILHGDNIKSWMGIPWYGIIRTTHRLKEMLAVKNENFEYMAIGHFHNQGTLDMMKGRRIINGSVIGGNEYSMGAMFTTSEASQFFCGIHKDEGITWEYHSKS